MCNVASGIMNMGEMVIMQDELVKSFYKLIGSIVLGGGLVAPRKEEKSVEAELDEKSEDGAKDISKETSNNGPKIEQKKGRNTTLKAKNRKLTVPQPRKTYSRKECYFCLDNWKWKVIVLQGCYQGQQQMDVVTLEERD